MIVWHVVVSLMIGGVIGFMTCAVLSAGKIADLQNKLHRRDHGSD
jgi:hypothetical protein